MLTLCNLFISELIFTYAVLNDTPSSSAAFFNYFYRSGNESRCLLVKLKIDFNVAFPWSLKGSSFLFVYITTVGTLVNPVLVLISWLASASIAATSIIFLSILETF